MPSNPKFHGERMNTLTHVWSTLYPEKDFSGLSLEEVRTGFQESFAARARLADLYAQLAATLQARKIADDSAMRLYQRAISAIKADANQHDSRKMLGALKFVASKSSGTTHLPTNSESAEEGTTRNPMPPHLRVIDTAA